MNKQPETIINILLFDDEIQVHWEEDIPTAIIASVLEEALESVRGKLSEERENSTGIGGYVQEPSAQE